MKNLLIALLALGTLSFVPSAKANRCCEPECTTKVHKQIVQEPCTKMVEIKGTCDHEICTEITTCTKKSKKCVGDCKAKCANGVTAADRGEEEESENE